MVEIWQVRAYRVRLPSAYPKKEAAKIAVSAIKSFLKTKEINVFLVLFDKESFELVKEAEMRELASENSEIPGECIRADESPLRKK